MRVYLVLIVCLHLLASDDFWNYLHKNNLNLKQKLLKNKSCKYPYSTLYLSKKYNFKFSCKKIDDFIKNINSISLVFSTYRYDSAGSIFGHIFLKIDTNTYPLALNYAASTNNDNIILYIYKGIFGKYRAKYKLLRFDFKKYEYNEEEFRDIYEFKLNLTKEQIKNLIYYYYENKDKTFSYYYFNKNCSSEITKLIFLSEFKKPLSKNIFLPLDSLYILKDKFSNGTKYLSLLSEFNFLIKTLSKKEKKLLKDYINNNIITSELNTNNNKLLRSIELYMKIDTLLNNYKQKYISKYFNLSLKYPFIKEYNKKKINQIPFSNKYSKISIEYRDKLFLGYRFLYREDSDLIDKINGDVSVFDIIFNKDIEELRLISLKAKPISNEFFRFVNKDVEIGYKNFYDKYYKYFNYGYGYSYKYFRVMLNIGGFYNQDFNSLLGLSESFNYRYKNNLFKINLYQENFDKEFRYRKSFEVFTKYKDINFYIKKEKKYIFGISYFF